MHKYHMYHEDKVIAADQELWRGDIFILDGEVYIVDDTEEDNTIYVTKMNTAKAMEVEE